MADVNSTSFPISLRPWKNEDAQEESLRSLVSRITNQHNGFRNVTEEQLEEQVRAEENGIIMNEAEDSEVEVKEEDEKGTRSFIAKKKMEMANDLRLANNETQVLLDSLSAIGSKYTSNAHRTMSVGLKSILPTEAYSYDKWDMSRLIDAKKNKDEAAVASGSTMESLTSSADLLLQAATRLKEEVTKETQYWDQVLSLHNKGWPVYKLPRDRRTTVVQSSAREAGPLFKTRGIAALRPNKNGTIKLDQGLSMERKTVRVRLIRDKEILGTSGLPSGMAAGDPETELDLEQVVRRAQDSLFDEELYHEIVMESRKLQPLGVELRNDVVHVPASPSLQNDTKLEWLIDLIPVDEALENDDMLNPHPQAVAILLRLLLSHLYRFRAKRRSDIPPLIDGKSLSLVPSIIQPMMAMSQHYNSYYPLVRFLSGFVQIIRAAGFDTNLEMDKIPGLTALFGTLDTTKRSKKQSSVLRGLMEQIVGIEHNAGWEQVVRPLRTSTSLSATSAADATTKDVISFDLITNLSHPLFGTEYVLNISLSLAKFISGRDSHSAYFIPKRRFVFSTIDELKACTSNIIAMNCIRTVIEAGHNDWRVPEYLVPEIVKVVQTSERKSEVAIGIEVVEEDIAVYMKWVSEGKELRRESWAGGKSKKSLVEVVEEWINELVAGEASGTGGE
ncbi:hypothetical protein EJ08DRAFT_678542 [Tothia fuscella]|uniref:Mediator of RNA polymerase II transcription subunit 17 n=1 Tax=Tothia fuscella TaxID=1048955 RepID=A0A9P4NT66_9PEZI|nr:hypothetical protein EJ08DRAFT_678542 [Tothia fuscella]